MPRYSKDTDTFPLKVWTSREQYLTTIPKVLVNKVKAGESVKGTFELRLEGDRLRLVLECE